MILFWNQIFEYLRQETLASNSAKNHLILKNKAYT